MLPGRGVRQLRGSLRLDTYTLPAVPVLGGEVVELGVGTDIVLCENLSPVGRVLAAVLFLRGIFLGSRERSVASPKESSSG
jgi:hypothetical protein